MNQSEQRPNGSWVEIYARLGNIEGKLDAALNAAAEERERSHAREQRIHALEERQTFQRGVVSGIAALVSAVVAAAIAGVRHLTG